MNNYYLGLKKAYRDNKELLEQVELLYNYDPKFKIFKENVLTKENINEYGIKALYNAIKYDKVHLLTTPSSKLRKFLELTPNLSDAYYTEKNITENDYKIIGDYCYDINLLGFLKHNHRKEVINHIVEIFRNKDHLKGLLFMTKYFSINSLHNTTFKDEQFDAFCDLIDTRYIGKYISSEDFYRMYNYNKKYISSIKTEEDKVKFNNYIFNYEYLYFPFYLDNYYEDRQDSVNYELNYVKQEELGDMISNVYCEVEYNKLKEIIEDAKTLGLTNMKLFDYNDKVAVREFIENHKEDSKIALDLLDQSKSKSKDLLLNNLKLNYIKNKKEIIKLDGQDFSFLVHKVSGLVSPDYALKLYRDPSFWNSNYEQHGYISTSYITNNHIGVVKDQGFMLGFNDVKKSELLQMGPTDIYTTTKMVANMKDNSYTRYMHPDDLINNTFSIYNEIVLRRYNENKEALMPDSIVAFDCANMVDKEMSNHFNVPIYEVNTKVYFDKLLKKYNYLIKHKEYKLACNTLILMVIGFNNSSYAKNTFLNYNSLDDELEKILSKDSSLQINDHITFVFGKAIDLLNEYKTNNVSTDIKKLKKGL